MKRRQFFKLSAAFSAPLILPASSLFGNSESATASGRIGVGLIGCGGRGRNDFKNMLNLKQVQGIAVCDVDSKHLQKAQAMVNQRYAAAKESGRYQGCAAYADYRELCARDDIDAVVVATPDHWHALAVWTALRAGKDVYCEKPITHLFGEGQAIYREVAKQKAIFQTGSQQRSSTRFRVAAEVVMNGLIGKIQRVEVGLPTGRSTDIAGLNAEPIPDHLDYDMWCGPSRRLPYHPKRVHFNWRWCLDYGGGQLMDWIGHHNDIAHWGLGLDKSGPIRVEAKNFKYPDQGMWDNPIDYEILSTYADGYDISISNKYERSCKWIGEDGYVQVSRGKLEASNREWLRESTDRGPIKAYKSRNHFANFFECVETRKATICPAETGHRSITPGHLGYISDTLKRPLKWDPVNEVVVDDPEADKLLKKIDYRPGWT